MKTLILTALLSAFAGSVFAAAHTAAPAAEKDTAAMVKDEKADNDKDKKIVKKATPKAKQGAKEEAEKTKAHAAKGDAKSDGSSK